MLEKIFLNYDIFENTTQIFVSSWYSFSHGHFTSLAINVSKRLDILRHFQFFFTLHQFLLFMGGDIRDFIKYTSHI